jgi:chromosome segregation ATPase
MGILTRHDRARPSERERRLIRLEAAEARRAAAIEQLDAEHCELVRQRARLADLAAAVLAGEAEAGEVAGERERVESRLATVDRALTDLREAGPGLKRRLDDARQGVADEREAEAKKRWLEDLAARNDAVHALAERLRAADEAAAELEAARAEQAASRRAYEEAVRAAGREVPALPDVADEPRLAEGPDRLSGVLSRGPLRPVAEERERDERAEAGFEVQRRERLRWVERHGTRRDLERLQPEDRARIERMWDEERARHDARR